MVIAYLITFYLKVLARYANKYECLFLFLAKPGKLVNMLQYRHI